MKRQHTTPPVGLLDRSWPEGSREDKAQRAWRMRLDGMLLREIGDVLGVSKSMAGELLADPFGIEVWERKRRNARQCEGCGVIVNMDGRVTDPNERCASCAAADTRRQSRRWIVESMREWCATFGAPPSAMDWNPAHARRSAGTVWKAERHEATGRPWPSPTLVQNHFGTWSAGIAAAGFRPLRSGEGGCKGRLALDVEHAEELALREGQAA